MGTRHELTTCPRLLALLGATVLGLSACGTSEPAEGSSTATTTSGSTSTSTTTTTSTSETSVGSPSSSATSLGPTGRTDVVFVPDLSGPAAERISANDLANELSAPFSRPATCEGDLVLRRGETQQCTGAAGLESQDEATWTARAAFVMNPQGYDHGVVPGVLFTSGPKLSAEAAPVLGTNLTGIGIGSMFGAEPISADDLASATLSALTADNAYVPVDEVADWTEVTCDDGMDFADFRPIACTAETADGGSWSLRVLPGTFADNDRGVLVGIDGPHEASPTD